MAKIVLALPQAPRLERLSKSPDEIIQDVTLDFAAKLLAAETVASVSASDSGTGLISGLTRTGASVAFDLVGGVHGERIPVVITVQGSAGSKRQAQLLVEISDPLAEVVPQLLPPELWDWRQDYDPAAVYRPRDIVRTETGIWESLLNQTGTPPIEGPGWRALFIGAAAPPAAPTGNNFGDEHIPFGDDHWNFGPGN